MRVKNDWRSGSKDNYKDFCKKNPDIKLSYDDWKIIIYGFNTMFMEHILETGDKISLPSALGAFSIKKKKRRKIKTIDGKEVVNLPIDWKKTREKGKIIYNFNFETEGFFFGWLWFKSEAKFKYSDIFYFKPCRNTSRLLAHYLKVDENYQHKYATWKFN